MNEIPPMTRSNSPSRYIIVTRDRKISFRTKLLRFIVRYLLPVAILCLAIVKVDMLLFKDTGFESIDKIKFIAWIFGLSIVCIIVSNLWFKLITKLEDK